MISPNFVLFRDCTFEKAYVQYRLNDNEGALATLSKGDPDDYRCLELKAQLLYRAENFKEAADLLKLELTTVKNAMNFFF